MGLEALLLTTLLNLVPYFVGSDTKHHVVDIHNVNQLFDRGKNQHFHVNSNLDSHKIYI